MRITPPITSGSRPAAGLAGFDGTDPRATLESAVVSATALSAELSLPVGNLAPRPATFFAKGLATRTTWIGRFHLNVGVGTYAVHPPATASSACSTSAFRLQRVGVNRTRSAPGRPHMGGAF
jgi:hypothetical protein